MSLGGDFFLIGMNLVFGNKAKHIRVEFVKRKIDEMNSVTVREPQDFIVFVTVCFDRRRPTPLKNKTSTSGVFKLFKSHK